jgi:hypothetical protein
MAPIPSPRCCKVSRIPCPPALQAARCGAHIARCASVGPLCRDGDQRARCARAAGHAAGACVCRVAADHRGSAARICPRAGGAAAKARAAQMQGFRGGGPNHMQQMMMQGGPEAAEFLEAEAMAAAFHEVRSTSAVQWGACAAPRRARTCLRACDRCTRACTRACMQAHVITSTHVRVPARAPALLLRSWTRRTWRQGQR